MLAKNCMMSPTRTYAVTSMEKEKVMVVGEQESRNKKNNYLPKGLMS